MKKLALGLVVGAALALTPLSSFALTAMSDSNMKDATGQAGVSIAVDEIALFQTVGETMYIDTDGEHDDLITSGAAVTISGKETFTTIRALLDDGNRNGFLKDTFGDAGYGKLLDGTKFDDGDAATLSDIGNRNGTDLEDDARYEIEIAALSIDVASNALVSSKIKGSDVAAVVIGIPTIEICKTGDTQTIGIWACDYEGNKTHGGTLIEITKTDSVMTTLGGTLEIAAH